MVVAVVMVVILVLLIVIVYAAYKILLAIVSFQICKENPLVPAAVGLLPRYTLILWSILDGTCGKKQIVMA